MITLSQALVPSGPDIVVTIGGASVPADRIGGWDLLDDEKGASTLTVLIANHDMAWSAAVHENDPISTRFGDNGSLGPTVHMDVGPIEKGYPARGKPWITVVGRDCMAKMACGNNRGMLGRKMTPGEAIKKEAEAYDIKVNLEGEDGPPMNQVAAMNETSLQQTKRFMKQLPTKSGGKAPTSVMGGAGSSIEGSKQEREAGYTISSANRIPEDSEGRDGNRCGNQANQASGEPIKGKLILKWTPTLRAKTCILVLDYGADDSGKYYVQKVRHSWQPGQGYRTTATVIRGGRGKGGVAGAAPNVMYAEIYQKDTVYCGPRKIEQAPTHTFSRLDGNVIEFRVRSNPQRQRHAGEPNTGKARGIDHRNLNRAYEEAAERQASTNPL